MARISSGGGNTDAFETSLSFPINVGSAGPNRRLIGFVGQSTDATPDITSASQITLDGSSTGVTLAATATNPIGQTGCVGRRFDIAIPDALSGTVNLAVNAGGGSTARKLFILYDLHSGIYGIRSEGYGSNTFDTTMTATPSSSASGDEVVLFGVNVASGVSITPTSPATALSGFSGTNFSVYGLRRDGGSSVSIAGTFGSSQEYCCAYYSLITTAPAPTAASDVRITDLTAGGCTVRWTDNSSDETGFKVEIAESPYSSWSAVSGSPAAANATSITLSGLSSTPKKVRVIATNGSGDATPAESPVFTPLAPAKLRPASDITVGSWVSSAGGALYAVLDETSADDGDYVSIAGTGTFEVKLASGADPGVGYGHTIRYRLQGDGSKQFTVRLVQGSTIRSTDPTVRTPPAGSWTTYSWTPTEAEANAITDYTDLRLRFTVA